MFIEYNSNIPLLINKYLTPSFGEKAFKDYLRKLFSPLSMKKEPIEESYIPLLIFCKVMELPLFISKHLYRVFASKQYSNLRMNDFIDGITSLYLGTFEDRLSIIFSLCDINQEGMIRGKDVLLMLRHLHYYQPSSFQSEEVIDILQQIINDTFNGNKYLTLSKFKENLSEKSDILILFLIYFEQYKPFQTENVNHFEKNTFNPSTHLTSLLETYNQSLGDCSEDLFTYINGRFNGNLVYIEKESNNSFDDLDQFEEDIIEIITDASTIIDDNSFNSNQSLSNVTTRRSPIRAPLRFGSVKLKEIDLNSSFKASVKSSQSSGNVLKTIINLKSSFSSKKNIRLVNNIAGIKKIKEIEKEIKVSLVNKDLYIFRKGKVIEVINMNNYYISIDTEHDYKDKKEYKILLTPYYLTYLPQIVIKCKDEQLMNDFVKDVQMKVNQRNIEDYYEFIQLIWKSEQSIIYKGQSINAKDKYVAVKIVSKKSTDKDIQEMISTEIEINRLIKICQPVNLISSIDIFESPKNFFIINEYLPNGTLNEYIDRKPIYQFLEFKELMMQLVKALNFLYNFGIIHRDLKPENILISKINNQVILKLNDFGLSKIIGFTEKTREPCGSLCYTAPEVLCRISYNHSVDVWSLGVMIYYLWYKQFPFYENNLNVIGITIRIKEGKYTFPRHQLTSNDDNKAIQKVIDCCLNYNPEKRVLINELMYI